MPFRLSAALLLACMTLPAHAGAAKLLLGAIEGVARAGARVGDDAAAGVGKAASASHATPVAGGLEIAPGQIAHGGSLAAKLCAPRHASEGVTASRRHLVRLAESGPPAAPDLHQDAVRSGS
ncbi:MAG: hypothetical protein ACK5PW_13690 [Burkholderiales bacterium]